MRDSESFPDIKLPSRYYAQLKIALKQDAEGIQNMSGVSLIGLIFIKWKQL